MKTRLYASTSSRSDARFREGWIAPAGLRGWAALFSVVHRLLRASITKFAISRRHPLTADQWIPVRQCARGLVLGLSILWISGLHDPVLAQTTPDVVESGKVDTWGYNGIKECPASQALCESWLTFRKAYPWPYQTFAVDRRQQGDEAVIVLSEPPPVISRKELHELLQAVFGSEIVEIWRFRWPTGVNGWLEDLVFRVKLTADGKALPVQRGHDFKSMELPAPLFDRLVFLHAFFHQTADGFYIEEIGASNASTARAEIRNLEVTPADIRNWLSDDDSKWQSLDGGATRDMTWRSVRLLTKSAALLKEDGQLVALVVPTGAPLKDVAAPFRRFSIASDLFVTAVQTKSGSTVFIARSRQVPFGMLPPLRFETFANLAANVSDELVQSYERKRLLAGRIGSGAYAGWDWAPIRLSPQLENTEFGTLLNLGDQILKSWSEHGVVQYNSFEYPAPKQFPFGDFAASEYFSDELGTNSLRFNLNNFGFSVITALKFGDALTGGSSNALRVLYEPTLISNSSPEDRERVLGPRLQQAAQLAADDAHAYFARQADPILIRSTQNVLMYQAIVNFVQVSNTSGWRKERDTRADAAAKTLRALAHEWLLDTMNLSDTNQLVEAKRLINKFLQRPGMTLERLAELFATPQYVEHELERILLKGKRLTASQKDLRKTLEIARREEPEAFEEFCQEAIRQGGRKFDGKCEYPVKPRAICKDIEKSGGKVDEEACYIDTGSALCARVIEAGGELTASGCRINHAVPATIPELRERVEELRADIEEIGAALEKGSEELESLSKDYNRIARDLRSAQDLSGDLQPSVSQSARLGDVFATVLAATEALESPESIQTPTVVVSKNQDNPNMVGGHSLTAEAQRVQPRARENTTKLRTRGGKVLLAMPDAQISEAHRLALQVGRGERLPADMLSAPPTNNRDIPTAIAQPQSDARQADTFARGMLLSDIDAKDALQTSMALDTKLAIKYLGGDEYALTTNPPPPGPTKASRAKAVEFIQNARPLASIALDNISEKDFWTMYRVGELQRTQKAGLTAEYLGLVRDLFAPRVNMPPVVTLALLGDGQLESVKVIGDAKVVHTKLARLYDFASAEVRFREAPSRAAQYFPAADVVAEVSIHIRPTSKKPLQEILRFWLVPEDQVANKLTFFQTAAQRLKTALRKLPRKSATGYSAVAETKKTLKPRDLACVNKEEFQARGNQVPSTRTTEVGPG
jgi:methyl-accepting chemotaxis protein